MVVVIVLGVSVVAVVLPSLWLLTTIQPLYGWSVGMFFVQVSSLVGLAIASTLMLTKA
jgi:hypothetical protein